MATAAPFALRVFTVRDEIPKGEVYRVNKLTVNEQTAISTIAVHHLRKDSFSTCSGTDISTINADTGACITEAATYTRYEP